MSTYWFRKITTSLLIKLSLLQNHFATLKTRLIRLQAQSHFLENMAKENWSSTDEMEITGLLYNTMLSLNNVISESSNLPESLLCTLWGLHSQSRNCGLRVNI